MKDSRAKIQNSVSTALPYSPPSSALAQFELSQVCKSLAYNFSLLAYLNISAFVCLPLSSFGYIANLNPDISSPIEFFLFHITYNLLLVQVFCYLKSEMLPDLDKGWIKYKCIIEAIYNLRSSLDG